MPHLVDLVPLAIGEGIEQDAGLVLVTILRDGHVHCELVCGCSLVVGAGMRPVLLRYRSGDPDRADHLVRLFQSHAVRHLDTGTLFLHAIRGADEHWRSFRGERLWSIEERQAAVAGEMN